MVNPEILSTQSILNELSKLCLHISAYIGNNSSRKSVINVRENDREAWGRLEGGDTEGVGGKTEREELV